MTQNIFLKSHTFIVLYSIIGLRISGKSILKELFYALHQIFCKATHCLRHLILSAYITLYTFSYVSFFGDHIASAIVIESLE